MLRARHDPRISMPSPAPTARRPDPPSTHGLTHFGRTCHQPPHHLPPPPVEGGQGHAHHLQGKPGVTACPAGL